MNRSVLWCALLPLQLLTSAPAHADANGYVHLPDVVAGEHEIDLKWGRQQERSGSNGAAGSVGLGYGVNDVWFTEVYGKYVRDPGADTVFDATEWENRFRFTEAGQYPVDVGFLLEIERPTQRADGYEVTLGPLLQTQSGPWQGNLNLLMRDHVRSNTARPRELLYEAQLRYRHQESLDWGLQALGSFGAWQSDPASLADGRSHRIGPAWFGKLRTGDHTAVVWNAAVLFRVGQGPLGTTLRLQAEYEF